MNTAIIIFGSIISAIGGVIVTYLIIMSSRLGSQTTLWEKNEDEHKALRSSIGEAKSDLKTDIARMESHIIRVEGKIDNLHRA